MTAQLALPFRHVPGYDTHDFLPHAGVATAQAWLAHTDWPGGRLALHGPPGTGKTHLLRMWARGVGATLGLPSGWPTTPLALDDPAPNEALLHALNAAAEAGQPVLLAGRTPPGRLVCPLPDLTSRLRAVCAIELRPGDDMFRATLLARLLSERQLVVAGPVQAWLLTHLPRDAGALREAAARLDHAALAAQRAITQPFVTAVLGL